MVAKWAIVDVCYGREVIETSIQEFFYRTGNNMEYPALSLISIIIQYNFKYIGATMIIISIIANVIMISLPSCKTIIEEKKINLLPFVVTAFMPIVWYAVLKNHSLAHAFFTYRNLCILIFNIEIILITGSSIIISKILEKKGKLAIEE